jgi:hypothetical protein
MSWVQIPPAAPKPRNFSHPNTSVKIESICKMSRALKP